MRSIGLNADECRKALESYAAEIEELMELVDGADSMSHAQIEEARNQLKNLKECLGRDHKLRDKRRGREQMTQVEASIFAPAVHQALVDLHISAGSRPSGQWFSELYGIQITIKHALGQLEGWQE